MKSYVEGAYKCIDKVQKQCKMMPGDMFGAMFGAIQRQAQKTCPEDAFYVQNHAQKAH